MNIHIRPSTTSLSDFFEGFALHFEQFEERQRLGQSANDLHILLVDALFSFEDARIHPSFLTDDEEERLAKWTQAILTYTPDKGPDLTDPNSTGEILPDSPEDQDYYRFMDSPEDQDPGDEH